MKLFAFGLILAAAVVSAGQSPSHTPADPDSISGGVLNGRASYLAIPEYSPAARTVRACGTVNVRVRVNDIGTVVEATSISGHPLLRATAVSAALKSKFLPTRIYGQQVTVSGIIVYNFICEITLLEIGYDLSNIENGGITFRGADTSARLPSEWKDEISRVGELQRLIEASRWIESETNSPQRDDSVNARRSTQENQTRFPTIAAEGLPGDSPQIVARELIGKIGYRLTGSPEQGWSFLIGVAAARLVAAADDAEALNAAAIGMQSLIDSVPANASKSVLAGARELLEAARAVSADQAQKAALLQKAKTFKSNKLAI